MKKPLAAVLLGLTLLASTASAQTPAPETPTPTPTPEPGPPPSAAPFRWQSVAGGYHDPTSVFALHGYLDGVFAGASRDWTRPDPTRPGPPGQLLVPNTNVASFQFDAGMVLSSQISARTEVQMELHLVTDPSGGGAAGPGGLTLALTEATASWQIAEDTLRLSGGLYWAPFGTVNHEWMGAQNVFSLIPRASSAFPVHWNERGIRLDGAKSFSEKAAVNYVVSYGNGMEVPDITGQIGYDRDDSKALVGRVGLFPGVGSKLDIGFSFARMRLRQPGAPELARPLDDARHYGALVRAQGIDANLRSGNGHLRSYLIWSSEDLEATAFTDPQPADLRHVGFLLEGTYVLRLPSPRLSVGAIAPKARFDLGQVEMLQRGGTEARRHKGYTTSIGFNIYPSSEIVESQSYPYRNFYLSLEYHFLHESTGEKLKNNRFVARITGRF